jgi:predicted transcriptional regulator
MKTKEKEQARTLRQEGKSVREIADLLNVSRSSVSLWVRDIELTEGQKQKLLERNPAYNPQIRGKNRNNQKWRDIRQKWQEEGRLKAREGESLFLSGCMLYWAEGNKGRNNFGFTNTDINMMRFFLNFLKSCFEIKDEDVRIKIICYTDSGLTAEEIENFWLKNLILPKGCLLKGIVNPRPKTSQGKRKSKYGVCILRLTNGRATEVVQKIYGGIQEYACFDNLNWLDCKLSIRV